MRQKQILIHNKVENVEDRGDVVWAMDQDYKLTAYNNSFKEKLKKESLGTPVKGMDLKPIYQDGIFFSPCKKGCEKALNRYATTVKHTFEEEGNTYVHEFSFQPFMDVSGDVAGCCIWQKDITEEVGNIHKLWDSERKYREAQRIANVGHWEWDMIKDEIIWSNQLYHIFHQNPQEFKASYGSLMAIVHPEDREAFQKDVDTSIQQNVIHDIVHRIVVGDSEIRYVHQKGRTFYDEFGNPVRMAGTTQDVTLEVMTKQQIVQQNNELQNFIRIISHNLRGPISNLLMLSKIYDWGRDEMNDDIVRKIENTTEALDQTIKDLNLSLSLKNADREQFREIKLVDVMKDVDGLLSEEIIRSKATVNTDFTQAETIFGLKSYMVNIFYNLILNAIHYAKEDVPPIIQLVTEESSSSVILKVSDNGIGMELSPEKERKIFNMYGRLSGATEGKGLGLYLVKTQVEAMNGKIGVESEKEVGTTFTIHFEKQH
ncbi:PAS domain-containing sensor histidine kinase [Allomuricauda taeanensis]|uniref:sensor histidine kinase n=1 Tax=Flagellimonas taeanensis TaxID=1005926 RepID=UPI002E7B6054|nr:PAS domain-containing sensor histidine kinase [Allomuricauda taeanensis]MEE1962098.1 PAS domain-containing sensor histidine kinase [Allomuricauda taeanensis]